MDAGEVATRMTASLALQGANAFDEVAIRNHFGMLHHLAERTGLPGKLVLSAIADKATGLPIVNQHFDIGDVDGMVVAAMAFEAKPYGLYAPYCIMRHDLPPDSKGSQDDVVATLAFPVDADSDHLGKTVPHAPVTPNYVVESSAGNLQEIIVLHQPLGPAESKPLARALKEKTGDKNCVGDIARVMRVPGTLNWPSTSKINRGRSREPQPVRVIRPWDSWTTAEELRAAVAFVEGAPPLVPNGATPALGGYRHEEVLWWIDRKMATGDLDWSQQDWAMFGGALKLHFGDGGLELFQRVSDDPDQAERRFRKFSYELSEGDRTLHWYLEGRETRGIDWMFRHHFGCPMPPPGPSGPLPVGGPLPEGWHWTANGQAERYAPAPPPGALIKSSAEFLRGFIPPDYILDGVLQRGFCYSMTAKTGTGKTAVAMCFSAHVATGRALNGLSVTQGDVIYLAGENPTDIQMRWLGLTQEMRIDPETVPVYFLPGVISISQNVASITQEVKEKCLTPTLVVVDTAAAYFEGDNENDNVQQGNNARLLRSLTQLPGGPCVLVLCHPTKRAGDDDLLPRGGGAFLNEVDGNIALKANDTIIGAEVQGKFRGPAFSPLTFKLDAVREHPMLKDSKGRSIPTVIARAISEGEMASNHATQERDENRLLRLLEKNPKASLQELATLMGGAGKSKVNRLVQKLIDTKLIRREGRKIVLTQIGQKELNDLDTIVSPTFQTPFSGGPFPVLPPVGK